MSVCRCASSVKHKQRTLFYHYSSLLLALFLMNFDILKTGMLLWFWHCTFDLQLLRNCHDPTDSMILFQLRIKVVCRPKTQKAYILTSISLRYFPLKCSPYKNNIQYFTAVLTLLDVTVSTEWSYIGRSCITCSLGSIHIINSMIPL